MKKILFLTLLVITSFQTINSQEKSEKDLISSGKWFIEYMQMGEKKMSLPVEMKKMNWVIFHKGGKQEGVEQGKQYVGEWEYDEKKRILKTNDLDGVKEQTVISVTNEKFIISVIQEGAELIIGLEKE